MKVLNNTHYFNEWTRLYNEFPDTNSFTYESNRRLSYFQRMYFEQKYTESVGGQTFYYTFTYNDKSIPKYLKHHNCFSYDHIRLITNGVLSKRLRREFGSRLRYICTCESGDGKGKRGLGNNPHYHFIFYVQPLHDKDCCPIYDGYVKIHPLEFLSICQDVWQGSHSFIDWRVARFGHVQEGLNQGVVFSSDALSYCGKYVLKDAAARSMETFVKQFWTRYYRICSIDNRCLLEYYKYLRLQNLSQIDKQWFFKEFAIDAYCRFRRFVRSCSLEPVSYLKFLKNFRSVNEYYMSYDGRMHHFRYDLAEDLVAWFHQFYIPMMTERKFREFKNLYGSKVRCSKTLGEYGLNFIDNIDSNPSLVISTPRGYKTYPPCLYFLRKLYYRVVICPVTHNPLYVLSERGVQLKLSQLKYKIPSYVLNVKEIIDLMFKNCLSSGYFEDRLEFDSSGNVVLHDNRLDLDFYLSWVRRYGLDNLLYRYSVYHFVYQYRSYDTWSQSFLSDGLLFDDILSDYNIFLRNSFYYLDFDDQKISSFYISDRYSGRYKSFSTHPVFAPYIDFFNFLDKLIDSGSRFLGDLRRAAFNKVSEDQSRYNTFIYETKDLALGT